MDQAHVDAGDRPGVTSSGSAEIRELKAENRRQREDDEISKSGLDLVASASLSNVGDTRAAGAATLLSPEEPIAAIVGVQAGNGPTPNDAPSSVSRPQPRPSANSHTASAALLAEASGPSANGHCATAFPTTAESSPGRLFKPLLPSSPSHCQPGGLTAARRYIRVDLSGDDRITPRGIRLESRPSSTQSLKPRPGGQTAADSRCGSATGREGQAQAPQVRVKHA